VSTSNSRSRAASTASEKSLPKPVVPREWRPAGPPSTAPLWILAAAVLWGTTGTALALAPAAAHPLTVGTLRLVLGGPLLLACFRPALPLPARTVPPLFLAGLAIALYQPAFFLGVQANGVAIGTLVAIGSAPLLAALLQAVFDRRAPSRRWSLATGLTLAGLTLVMQPGSSDRLTAAGISASLGAGCAYAVFVLATRRCIAAGVGAQQAVAIAFTVAAVVLAPTLVWAAPSWLFSLRGLAVVLHLGIVATFVAYSLFARGASRTPAATTATLSLAEPLTASVLATLVLAEPFGRTRALGAAVLLGGLALLAFADRARPESGPLETDLLERPVVGRKR